MRHVIADDALAYLFDQLSETDRRNADAHFAVCAIVTRASCPRSRLASSYSVAVWR